MTYFKSNFLYLVILFPQPPTHDFSLILAGKIEHFGSKKQKPETLAPLAEDADATG